MKRIALLMLIMGLISSCGAQSEKDLASGDVNIETAKELMKDSEIVVLDVRTPEEITDLGHLENAISINFSSPDFEEKLAELDKNKTYLVYCHSGGRSGRTMNKMMDLGFEKVYNLDGGISEWIKGGNPVKH